MKRLFWGILLQFIVFTTIGQIKLSGIVTAQNEPLTGASITIDNTMYGLSTRPDGTFEFRNLKPGDYVLTVSYIGFIPEKVKLILDSDKRITIELKPKVIMTEEVMVAASVAKNTTPVAFQNIKKQEIAGQNLGQDMPYLMQLSPSFVSTSDAGTGIGYTSFRIRGTDMNRINVAINGIPLNDAESHGTWFVDQPDMASSLDNIQIQRGVGTSANGAGAFGATINMQTSTLQPAAYAEYNTAFGSFNTFKNTVMAGTGLIDGKFAVDTRLSKLTSSGYIDRADADLRSFFVSAGYFSSNTILKAVVFAGSENTYQAWNGVPSDLLETNRTYNSAGEYTDQNGLVKYYENQVDDYLQSHYQLHFSHAFNRKLKLNLSAHFTHGKGFYENYDENADLAGYQIPPVEIEGVKTETSDIVNRKWLDNNFYGTVYSLNYRNNMSDFTFGGGYSVYDGNHFGKVIWGQYLGNIEPNHDWYRSTGLKKDFNVFARYNYILMDKLNLFADLQYRHINYSIDGIDNDLRNITQVHLFDFFNPKIGAFCQLQQNQDLYLSFSVANREPNRSNYVDADPNGKQPVHETLHDWEFGYNFKSSAFSFSVNYFFMNYKNQLVLTGEINDVGAPIMVNVDKSYRTGIELMAAVKITGGLQWKGNTTISENKIMDFTEFVDNWDTWTQESFYLGKTFLAFAPGFTGNSQFIYSPVKNLDLILISSYVGKQYIDNTSNSDRLLHSWFVNSINASYTIKPGFFKSITFRLLVNNLFDEKYESNAWVYSYISEGKRLKMDGYFPQVGTNFMIGADFKF